MMITAPLATPLKSNSLQLTKGPIRNSTVFDAPGVRFKSKRVGGADTDLGGGGDEVLVRLSTFLVRAR